MGNPTLGGTTIACPKESTIKSLVKKGEFLTLGGKTRWDITGRKYEYELHWDFINVTDYETIETKVKTLVAMTFAWDKYTVSTAGVSVYAELSIRSPNTPGDKDTGFYSDVVLTLTEVNNRM